MDYSKIVKGEILSESSFFKVVEVEKDALIVLDENNNKVKIGKDYAVNLLNSASSFNKEEKKNMTELADILINSSRIAMTVAFFKKDGVKTKKAYEAEKKEIIEKVQNAKVSEVETLLNNLIENPLSKVIPGELRIMKGRHYGHIDDLGRLQFVDMEVDKGTKDFDARMRQIDPRTLQYIIVNNVKYILK